MDELLKSLSALINTGGALADDALYLYFALKLVEAASWTIPASAFIALGYKAICRSMALSRHRTQLEVMRMKGERMSSHGYTWRLKIAELERLGFERAE